MALSLSSIIYRIFTTGNSHNRYNYRTTSAEIFSRNKYMEIPITGDSFEVPIFATNSFLSAYSDEDTITDAIIVQLNTRNINCGYTSLNKVMEQTLLHKYSDTRLMVIKDKNAEDTYYGTYGAIFDKYFNPILICSWMLERFKNEDGQDGIKAAYPIIRISPDSFASPKDSIERFVCKKFPTEALLSSFYCHNTFLVSINADCRSKLKIIIERSPFVIREADVPSVSTTNESLIQTALDHIDDFICK